MQIKLFKPIIYAQNRGAIRRSMLTVTFDIHISSIY